MTVMLNLLWNWRRKENCTKFSLIALKTMKDVFQALRTAKVSSFIMFQI